MKSENCQLKMANGDAPEAIVPPSLFTFHFSFLTFHFFVAAILISGFIAPGTAAAQAQDDIVHRRNGIITRGRILSNDSSGVRMQIENGKEITIPADQIERLDAKLTPQQQEGEKLFDEGDYRGAVAKLEAARKAERREWLRGRLESKIVAAQVALGDSLAAIDAFLAVSKESATSMPWSAVPLAWLPEPPPAALRERAAELLRSKNAAEQLIGASYLFGTDDSAAARDALAKLKTYRDERIGQLARAQLWRWEVSDATPEAIESWQRQAAKLPLELRGPANFVIGLAWRQAGRHEDAALAFLWPATLLRSDPRLAGRAALMAAQSLEAAGQRAEAKQIYQEVVTRFAKSTEAGAARTRLAALNE